jgi:hypothetical protein
MLRRISECLSINPVLPPSATAPGAHSKTGLSFVN